MDQTGLGAGSYPAVITVSSPAASNSPQTIAVTLNVMAAGFSATPFGSFDTPIHGSSVFGSIPVTGWALDDIEVTRVEIKRSPHALDNPVVISPDGLVYVGDAVFVEGARPDVANTFPTYPLNYRAGWGYMLLTNMLPNYGNGPYTLHAIAYDKEGNSAKLAERTFNCTNATAVLPFGAIDTPAQGGTASGTAYVNFGWALTPQPAAIPADGSTIWVWVDGVAVGHPVYNNYRSDIANKFPGYANSNGAVGYYYLDTTAYANGVHTIAWSVVDSGGNVTGIGSRFFTIFNSGTGMANVKGVEQNKYPMSASMDLGAPLSWSVVNSLPVSFDPVRVRKGYALESEPEVIHPDSYGVVTIEIPEVERIEVDLSGSQEEIAQELAFLTQSAKRMTEERIGRDISREKNRYSGYLIINNELHSLPIGSTLDPSTGLFSWQPGPGFLGEYAFVFVREDRRGTQRSIDLSISIVPKFSILYR